MRKHLIEQYGLGNKVISYSLGGMSYSQIADKLEREHGLKLTKASVCRWLAKHGETVAVVRRERTNEELAISIDGVKKLASEILLEIERRLPESESNPYALVALLRLKLAVIDRMARMLGAYSSDRLVVAPSVLDCGNCPDSDHRGNWIEPLPPDVDRIAAILEFLNDAGALSFPCPHCGKVVSNIPTILPHDHSRTTGQEDCK